MLLALRVLWKSIEPTSNICKTILQQFGLDGTSVKGILPATPMQVHMPSVWQNTKGEVFYPTFSFRLTGGVDPATVHSAWQTLVMEIPVLRTTFVSTRSRDVPFLQVILRGSPKKPYATIGVDKGEDGQVVLRLRIHHALYDAVSLPAILARLVSLCGGSPGEVPRIDVSAWKAHVASRFSKDDQMARRHFWMQYLSEFEPPSPCATPTEPANGRASLFVSSAVENINLIRSLCFSNGITVQSLFFACYAKFLTYSSSAPKDVVFGVYLANRSEDSLSLYPTLRLVPLRVQINQGTDLLEVAEKIQQDLLAISAQPHVDVGLWEVLEWTGVRIDTFVNFLNVPGELNGADGEKNLSGGLMLEEIPSGDAATGANHEEWQVPEEVQDNVVRDAYPASYLHSS